MTASPRLIRRLSWGLLAGWVALLGGLFAVRQVGRGPQVTPPATPVSADGERPVTVHRSFVHTVTVGSDPSFRVAAREALEFASGWYEMRDVEIALYSAGEVAYGLAAEKARFNRANQEATIEGGARLSLSGGVVMRAPGFTVRGPRRLVESTGGVTFAGPGWGGIAGGMQSSLADDTIALLGDVSVTWRREEAAPALVLLAPRLDYARRRALVTFPEGLTILRADVQLRTPSAVVQLVPETMALHRATLAGPVALDGQAAGRVEARAGATVVESRGPDRLAIAAEADAGGWVEARWKQPGAGWREMTARRLVGEGSPAAWEWLEGQGQACAVEERSGEPAIRVEAERIRLGFEAGQAAVVEAAENVVLTSGPREASAGALDYRIATGSYVLTPPRKGRVVARGAEGEVRADRIEGASTDPTRATGHVDGTATQARLWGDGGGPVHFAAVTAELSPDRNVLTLEGDARVWQGERLVRADRLVYDTREERVTGSGGVLTSGSTVDASGASQPFEVAARSLEYSRPAGIGVYEGEVVLTEPRATTRTQRLTATLDPNGGVKVARLEGGVEVREKATGRTLRGERGRMAPAQGLFELWGTPVVIEEPGGNQVKANHVEWRPDSSSLVLLGDEDQPTDTVYFPQATPTPAPKRRRP